MTGQTLVVCGLPTYSVEELRERGFEIEVAEDGYRAIELTERVHPKAALVSDSSAGPDARDLVRRIKAAEPGCGVILLVHQPEPDRDADLLRAGADGVIPERADTTFITWSLARVAEGGLVIHPAIAKGVAQDLTDSATERMEWARQLAERTKQAEELARAKSDFLGNVSHELRTPLTIIKGVAGMLRTTQADGKQDAMLSQVDKAADKLVLMIESIITHASMERGEYSLNFQRCDLVETIRSAAEEGASGYPDVNLDIVLPEQVPAIADVRAIRGVVRQLVDNGARYSDAGGVVTVKARCGDEGVTIHVTDRGVGVDREKIANALAEAFSPGEAIMTKERAGLGLGLNLSRNLVGLHGGILWAEPLPGGGSRVSFTIPPGPAPDVVSVEGAPGTTVPRL